MAFPIPPNNTHSEINRQARLVPSLNPSSDDYSEVIKLINAWRVAHAYPLNTFYATLRKKSRHYTDSVVAQRLKRLPTIIDKLVRQPTMDLTRMQDIGGVRIIVEDILDVPKVMSEYYSTNLQGEPISKLSHPLAVDPRKYDYIVQPKSSGYRSAHLVFSYNNTQARRGNPEPYNGLLIEMQFRTKLQHQWSTAVETVGAMTGEDLKSSRGSSVWLDFFKVISSVFALSEDCPLLHEHQIMRPDKLIDLAANNILDLDVVRQLKGWNVAANAIKTQGFGGYYSVISIYDKDGSRGVNISGFRKNDIENASKYLAQQETEVTQGALVSTVLVSAGKISQLHKAYPNYFNDLGGFISRLEHILEAQQDAKNELK